MRLLIVQICKATAAGRRGLLIMRTADGDRQRGPERRKMVGVGSAELGSGEANPGQGPNCWIRDC